jgi:hypothetical protein
MPQNSIDRFRYKKALEDNNIPYDSSLRTCVTTTLILRTATMLKKVVIDHPDIDAILPSLTWSLLAPLNT